jgi:magnesium transporter
MTSSRFYYIAPDGIFYPVSSGEEAVLNLKKGGYIWIDLYNPTKEILNEFVGSLGIHPLSVEDCLDTSQVPKIEQFTGNTFFIFNSIKYLNKTLYLDEVDFFLGRNFLITVSGVNSDSREPFAGLESYLEKDHGLAKSGPAFLMHLILDYVVDQKFVIFDLKEDELEEYEDAVIEDPASFKPGKLINMRKDLANLRRSLYHEREILIKICRRDCPFISDAEIVHFRDIYDHLSKFFELTETHRETVTNLMELYSSLHNNLMTRVSNETNITVRRLTLITTVFMPLTLIAGIGGMSEWTMMTGGPENWKKSYTLFLIGMVVIGVLNFYLIRKLGKKDFTDK